MNQSREEEAETQHHPQLRLNRVQSSETAHRINVLFKKNVT